CYVGVDEKRRAFLGDRPVKNLDFIVLGPGGSRLLIDVKGRRFPMGPAHKPRRVWECWSTREDVDGLESWVRLFANDYLGLPVFMYERGTNVPIAGGTPDLWTWRGRRYLLRTVPIDNYRQHMRVRSPKWGTVHLPGQVFRDLVRPLAAYVQGPPESVSEAW